MKKIGLGIFTVYISACLFSQTSPTKDPQIERMVKEVSADSLRSYVNKLVSFGTRNTLSTQTDPKRGIGAARSWVLSRFEEFGRSDGRLTAIIDTTTYKKD